MMNFHPLESDTAVEKLRGKVNLSVICPKSHGTEVGSDGFL